ncbi:hypothetical protein NQ315_008119 [Exocentrus adspersus]|uniref:Uncharacterized protein n=1 Tax=Exocentrus adspersus TaxID=1586481 RepID=A0AAV8VVM1_9CUCU|nr:hypothetical protein NQ315_008119 [Exocentrus adspersus]
MTLTVTLVVVIAIASLASTATVPNPAPVDGSAVDYRPLETPAEPSTDSYQLYQPQVPVNIKLPNIELNPVPFYAPEPVQYLKAPSENQEPNFYQVPIPSQDLVAPIETAWNPNNDPTLYYEVPAVVTKQESPTNSYPKKFNKEIHSKSKPYSSRPKQELVLEPIDEKQFETKQKDLQKSFQQLAKKENRKQVEAVKVNNKIEKPECKEIVTHQKKDKELSSVKNDTEPLTAGTHFESEPVTESHHQGESNEKPSDQKLTASLDISASSHPERSSGGDRINFHMVGHDGPHSYKWGFDTGKGYNRQFRYEEKDHTGLVKGHYGFYDKNGKLQIVHYNSHPRRGYHAEGNFGKA